MRWVNNKSNSQIGVLNITSSNAKVRYVFIVFIIKNNDFNTTIIDNVSKSINYCQNYKEQTKCDNYLRMSTVLSVLKQKHSLEHSLSREINCAQESVLDLGQLLTSKYKLIQVSDLTRAG